MSTLAEKKTCTIIIPCYNEEAVIFRSLTALTTFLDTQPAYQWSVIAVSDGSTDSTVAEIQKCIATYEGDHCIVLHIIEKNAGKGNAIQEGALQLDTDYYGFIDADLSLDYTCIIPKMLELFAKADIIIAKRETRERGGYSKLRAIGSRTFSWLARTMFSLPYTDIQCGLKFFTKAGKDVLLEIEQTRFSFDVEFLVRARKKGLRIAEHVVSWKHNNDSSVGGSDMVRYVLDLFSITEIVYTKKKFTLIYAVAAVSISLICFGWTLKYGFFFSDDFTWLWHGSRIWRGELSVWTARMSTFYSPILNAFYAIMSGMVGFTVWVYFLFGILVHAGMAFVTGLLVRILTRSSIAGLIAVVLFALVGGAYEPLVWVGANMHSIAALFITVSVFALLTAYHKTVRRARMWLLVSFISLLCALATKEVAIVLPALLFFVSIPTVVQQKKAFFSLQHGIYWFATAAVSLVYVIQQYLWQRQSVWIETGIWELDFGKLARLPISLLDVFVPIKAVIHSGNASLYMIVALGLFGYTVYRFRKNAAVILGLVWAVCAALPVLFFQTETWWELLPSRYTYTVRVGMTIFVSAMIAELLRQSKGVRLAYRFFWVLLVASLLHTVSMVQTVRAEYGYVYQTGRALQEASLALANIQPTRVVVSWYRPFTRNHAHMVGALYVFAGMREEQIIFLEQDAAYVPLRGDVLLEWDERERTYRRIEAI